MKSFQLGPVAHVVENPPIASVLWHPLGHLGRCIVTITEDAVLRLWEFDKKDRQSFSEPTLSTDLKKLANATSTADDFRASRQGSQKGFSPDSVEMAVASASFGGSGKPNEDPWKAMTLYVATKTGDVYVLSPLLPETFQAPDELLKSLSDYSKVVAAELDGAETPVVTWIENIDRQRNREVSVGLESSPFKSSITSGQFTFQKDIVVNRPSSPHPVPKLQGPFVIVPDAEANVEYEIADIIVLPMNQENSSTQGLTAEVDGLVDVLSGSVICLSTTIGQVLVTLDFEGIEPQWLPAKEVRHTNTLLSSHANFIQGLEPQDTLPELLLVETVSLHSNSQIIDFVFPTFTPDIRNPHGFFTTDDEGVCYLSLSSWVSRLSDEFRSPTHSGSKFRLETILESTSTLVEKLIVLPNEAQLPRFGTSDITTSIVLEDSDLGYFLVTAAGGQAYAATFDVASHELYADSVASDPDQQDTVYDIMLDRLQLSGPEPRETYRPAEVFWQESALSSFLETSVPGHLQSGLKEQVRLSEQTLNLLTAAHRTVQAETDNLNKAVAELFRRCQLMQSEFHALLLKARDVKDKIDEVVGDDEDVSSEGEEQDDIVPSKTLIVEVEHRKQTAFERQIELAERVEKLRYKVARLGGPAMSDKEKAWMAELQRVAKSVGTSTDDTAEAEDANGSESLTERFDTVKRLHGELIPMAEDTAAAGDELRRTRNGTRVSRDLRKQKVEEVMGLLERETAVLAETTNKLDRLQRKLVS